MSKLKQNQLFEIEFLDPEVGDFTVALPKYSHGVMGHGSTRKEAVMHLIEGIEVTWEVLEIRLSIYQAIVWRTQKLLFRLFSNFSATPLDMVKGPWYYIHIPVERSE